MVYHPKHATTPSFPFQQCSKLFQQSSHPNNSAFHENAMNLVTCIKVPLFLTRYGYIYIFGNKLILSFLEQIFIEYSITKHILHVTKDAF